MRWSIDGRIACRASARIKVRGVPSDEERLLPISSKVAIVLGHHCQPSTRLGVRKERKSSSIWERFFRCLRIDAVASSFWLHPKQVGSSSQGVDDIQDARESETVVV